MARLLYEFPDVFDAYRAAVMEQATGQGGATKLSFQERREATRAERIRKAGAR